MKKSFGPSLRPLLIAVALFGVTSIGRSESVPGADGYAQAVNDYVDAAGRETGVFRSELERNEKEGKQATWAEVRQALDHCQTLIDQLKNSPASQFDPTKAKYEEARAELKAKIALARKS